MLSCCSVVAAAFQWDTWLRDLTPSCYASATRTCSIPSQPSPGPEPVIDDNATLQHVRHCLLVSTQGRWRAGAITGILCTSVLQGIFVLFLLQETVPSKSGRFRSRWSALIAIVGATVRFGHFLFGSIVWTAAVALGGWNWRYALHTAWPCFSLLLVSVITYVLAVQRHRLATLLIVLTAVLSVLAFWYDVSNEHWQIRVDIAAAEYWESHRSPYTYFTWWWY